MQAALLPLDGSNATTKNGRTGHAKVSTAYSQAKRLQELLFGDAERKDIKPLERSSVARVWAELEECKRKLKMKPLPGSLRPTSAKPQRRARSSSDFEPEPAPAPAQPSGDPAPSNSVPAPSPSPETTQEQK